MVLVAYNSVTRRCMNGKVNRENMGREATEGVRVIRWLKGR